MSEVNRIYTLPYLKASPYLQNEIDYKEPVSPLDPDILERTSAPLPRQFHSWKDRLPPDSEWQPFNKETYTLPDLFTEIKDKETEDEWKTK